MKYKVVRYSHSEETHVCQNCGNAFKGKICNQCGEKVFEEEQLSSKHFFHQIIDFFTHFENKVLKTIWLNIRKPGFITQQNLKGVRVPYANPIQLYLVVSILFYFTVSKIGVTDYTPSVGDHQYFTLSQYLPFRWAKPIDAAVIKGIDKMGDDKINSIEEDIKEEYYNEKTLTPQGYKVVNTERTDSAYIQPAQVNGVAKHEAEGVFFKDFHSHISTYSKTLIFCILPVMAGFMFMFFFSQLRVYGASLILATHFMVYNLCFFMFHCIVDWLPGRAFGKPFYGLLFKPIDLLYLPAIAPVTSFIFGSDFEFFHIIFWMPWLFFAFKRLFNKPWWANLLISYFCSRVFFYLIFGVLKKALIAYTIWTMH